MSTACPVSSKPRAVHADGAVTFTRFPQAEDAPVDGALWAIATIDGRRLCTLKLASHPVFDSLAAAGGRLYVSMRGGSLHCFGGT